MDIQQTVAERYAKGAQAREAALCCPVDYEARYLEAIPQEVLERDYGCGDPSRYVREGETVLDLGSGGGKICFIAAQIVGAGGRVIGVDMTDDMLALARGAAPQVARAIGHDVVEFRRGRIEDLQTDPDWLDAYLRDHPVGSAEAYAAMQTALDKQRRDAPLIADNSIDVIVSNCVLNLVDDALKTRLFAEMYRVLKPGGRIAVSDIVSDEPSPEHLKADGDLWSGCVSGALEEEAFIRALADAGFYGMTLDKFDAAPWQVVEGIEYRSVTVLAWKGKEGPCIEKNQAVIYKGPWKQVVDDDGHVLHRGARMAVCEKTFRIMTSEPYGDDIVPVPPALEIVGGEPFNCAANTRRSPQATKQGLAKTTRAPAEGGCC